MPYGENALKILVACEYSGRVRDAFIERGHDAMSCDILDTEWPGPHITGDVREVLYVGWDMMIAHPPCTYLSASGLHWNKRNPERAQKTEDALDFIELLWNAPFDKVCIENPVGCINTRLSYMPKPQYIQPYDFGEDASKKTGLWLRNLPPLEPTERFPGRMVNGKERWSNQTDSGQSRLGPSATRAHERSLTYDNIALAMAKQWG